MTKRQQEVLAAMRDFGDWNTALMFGTNRLTMNALYRLGLIEKKITPGCGLRQPEQNTLYRVRGE